jgi:hypothetical protein
LAAKRDELQRQFDLTFRMIDEHTQRIRQQPAASATVPT